jgi:hypothetical protein
MASQLLSCPSCECHVKATESTCPHCGSSLRREESRLPRTATAVALGLSAVLAAAGCEETTASPVYGIAVTGGGEGGTGGAGEVDGGAGMGGMGGMGGAGKDGGM